MPKKKISDLPAGSALTGIELVPIVQSGTTKRITAQDIADLSNASSIGGGGTANYVSKFTTEFNIGDSQIFDNGTSVGIATDTPNASYKLDVNGSLKATSIVKSGGTSAEYLKADGSVSTLTNPITGTGTTNYLPKFTGSTALGNSSVFDNGTSVGIGTATPNASYKLDINGGVHISSGNFYRYATDVGIIGSGTSITGGLSTQLGIRSSSDILFSTGGSTERMRINSVGNLGLGITPATATGRFIQFGAGAALSTNNTNNSNFWHNTTFDASGNTLYAVTGQQSSYYRQINGLHAWATAPSGTAGNAITFTTNMVLDASGRLGIGNIAPTQKLSVVGANSNPTLAGNEGTFSVLQGAADYGIVMGTKSSGNGWVQVKRIDGSATAYNLELQPLGGAVLINTTTDAGYKLDVNGTARVNSTFLVNTGTANQNTKIFGNKVGMSRTSDGAEVVYFSKNTDLGAEGTANINGYDGIQFRTQGTESVKAVITSAGNLGIGITSPSTKLHILSNNSSSTLSTSNTASLVIQNTYGSAGATGGALFFKSDTGTNNTFAGIGGDLSGSTSSGSYGHLIFGTKNTATDTSLSERMRITSAGNVGINTTTPGRTLSVNGQIGLSDDLISTNGSNVLRLGYNSYYGSSGFNLTTENSIPLTFGTASTEKMRITSGGNVLINKSTDAGYKLDVAGTTRLDPAGGEYGLVVGRSSGLTNIKGGADDGGYLLMDSGDQGGVLGLNWYSVENVILVNGGGRVGVGTSSPDASAKMQIDSTTQGFLVPRMGEGEINSISSPAAGLMVYNTDQNHMCMFDGSVWKKLSMSNM